MAVEKAAVTLAELKKGNDMPEANLPAVQVSFDSLQGFSLMQRVARSLAASSLVPTDYQGNIPNCLIALEMAHRIGASPLMVMQNLYVVYGRPSWSAQFLIASFNQCGRFTAMKFRYQGEEGTDKWGCRAYAKEKATGEEIVGPLVTLAIAKAEGWFTKKGSKWQTIPELMLMYRSAGWMVRTHAPEISMGLHTSDEVSDYGVAVDAPFEVTQDEIAPKPEAAVGTAGTPLGGEGAVPTEATDTPAAATPPEETDPFGGLDGPDPRRITGTDLDLLTALAKEHKVKRDDFKHVLAVTENGPGTAAEKVELMKLWLLEQAKGAPQKPALNLT